MPPARASRAGEPWSENEDQLLCRYYPLYNSVYTSRLLGRSRGAVKNRAVRLRITDPFEKKWSKAEDRFLRNNRNRMTVAQLAGKLRRSISSVTTRLRKIGLTAPNAAEWSEKEIAFLWKYCHTMPHAELAARLGRTRNAVVTRIGILGIPPSRTIFIPTKRDLAFIRRNLGRLSFVEMGARLGTGADAVRTIAVGIFRARPTTRPWTTKDDAQLRKLYGTMPRKDVAMAMNRTWKAASTRASQLGLTNEIRPWSRREDAMLTRLHRAGTSYAEMARRLGRTWEAVHGRVRNLRLTATQPMRRYWSEQDEKVLRELHGTCPDREIAERLGRSVISVRKKAHALGIGAASR